MQFIKRRVVWTPAYGFVTQKKYSDDGKLGEIDGRLPDILIENLEARQSLKGNNT